MKVLFAVNNDNISEAVLKKYQQDYKEIISYKNVYYFNAILKELQKDKSYDRVVISEDLEPFANNNYDTIDKFLFEKLDKISDEATNEEGNETQVIFICSDRRAPSDTMLTKMFSIGVYNAVLGQDRSIEKLCELIRKPRGKKEAKIYYKIISDNANYENEEEGNVSEVELQNILAYYKKIGKNEEKYLESFNSIVSQYTDTQLRIIIKYLPLYVKAVLEEKSPKYQELVLGHKKREIKTNYIPRQANEQQENKETVNVKMIKEQTNKEALQRPIVVPSNIEEKAVKKLIKAENTTKTQAALIDEELENDDEQYQKQKKGRGRPKKAIDSTEQNEEKPKRGRGRPKKDTEKNDTVTPKAQDEDEDEDIDFFYNQESDNDEDVDLFDLDNDSENSQEERQDENEQNIDLLNLSDTSKNENEKDDNDEELDLFNLDDNEEEKDNNLVLKKSDASADFSRTLTRDKKIVSFVGTTKNGTSFVVNNLAELLSSMGIPTAILDMTKTKNSYYIYTNNEENLRQTASKSIEKLKSGIAEGVKANKNLTIFTDLPGEEKDYSDVKNILETLARNFSVVLIDCDFNTSADIFDKSQEIYLVQSMDVLTIQPLTAFLRNLKSKGVLKQEKIKIIINKEQKVKGLSPKVLIGGIAFYNDPAMSYMTELFNREKTPYCVIHFETQNYVKYLESLVNCSIKLNGYTKGFMIALKELANMVYPLINRQQYSPRGNKYKDTFPNEMNDTLNKMKNTYN